MTKFTEVLPSTEFAATLPNATISTNAPTILFTPAAAGGTVIVDQKGKGRIAEYAIEEFVAEGGRGFRFTEAVRDLKRAAALKSSGAAV